MWFLFALLSPAAYSVVCFIDKYLLEKKIPDYRGMPLFGSLMGLIFGMLFFIGSGFSMISLSNTFFIILSGMFTLWGAAFYFHAMAKEDASNVIILNQFIPLFVLILSCLFLHEIITARQLCGFFLILVGTAGISVKEQKIRLRFSSAFLFMIFASIFWASGSVLFKFVVDVNTFSKVVSYESWGIALGGLFLYVLFPSIRSAFHKTMKTVSKKTLIILFFNEGMYVISKLFAFLAMSLGSVSLVSIVGSTSIFFGILYGWILTLLYPKVFQENISKEGLFKKIGFSIIVFLGIVFLVFPA
jgi:bacterial/archaeal transporter family protein